MSGRVLREEQCFLAVSAADLLACRAMITRADLTAARSVRLPDDDPLAGAPVGRLVIARRRGDRSPLINTYVDCLAERLPAIRLISFVMPHDGKTYTYCLHFW
ncbi:hypothetical protein [Pseudonocardia sp. TRM90224]|uniref:hypothetical protein n=1 Tax=Pseudonocardia sp. TRM90224 TaxID=2812678 RepID=UPI001E5C8E05|nr:hypothetical protein [Pseudonocardia sp. TRM90224]